MDTSPVQIRMSPQAASIPADPSPLAGLVGLTPYKAEPVTPQSPVSPVERVGGFYGPPHSTSQCKKAQGFYNPDASKETPSSPVQDTPVPSGKKLSEKAIEKIMDKIMASHKVTEGLEERVEAEKTVRTHLVQSLAEGGVGSELTYQGTIYSLRNRGGTQYICKSNKNWQKAKTAEA